MRRFLIVLFFICLLSCGVSLAAARGELDYSLDKVSVVGRGSVLHVRTEWTIRDWNVADNDAMVFNVTFRGGGHTLRLRPLSVYGRKAARSASFLRASGESTEVAVRDVSDTVRVVLEEDFPFEKGLDTLRMFLSVGQWNSRRGMMQLSYGQKAVFTRPEAPGFRGFEREYFEPARDFYEWRRFCFSVPLSFDGASTVFDPSANDSVDDLVSRLKALCSYRKMSFRNTSLQVSCAPLGAGADLDKICKGRALSLYNYLSKKGVLSRFKVTRNGVGVDWDGIVSWLSSSRFQDDRRLVEIVSADASDASRLSMMEREKPAAWEFMSEECFPYLGRADFVTEYKPFNFVTPSEVLSVSREVPELLSAWDFWFLAGMYERDSDEWLDVLLQGARLHPESWELNCDVVQALVKRGGIREASFFLRYLGGSPAGQYVRALWCYAAGQYDDCIEIVTALSEYGGRYAVLYENVLPFIRWQTNNVVWKRMNL